MVQGIRSSCKIQILALVLSLAIPALLFATEASAKAVDERIYIAPAGNVDKAVLQEIKSALPGIFPMVVSIELAPEEELPSAAYDPVRKQYDAGMVLEAVAGRNNLATTRESMIVVTDADMYYGDADHVFGLSNAKTKICIISLARLGGEMPDRRLFLESSVRSAAIELGYVLGLKDCSDPKCMMSLSKSPADEIKKKTSFCRDCKRRLRSRYSSALIKMPVF